MRGLFSIVLVPGLLLSVLALPAAAADGAPAASAAAPAAPAGQSAAQSAAQAAPAAVKPHVRRKWEEHFAQANKAHDGHLTLEEAKAGYPTIARHFHSIDVDGKGFVTVDDVRAWHALRRATAHLHQTSDDGLRPRNAFQRTYPDEPPKPQNTSTTTQVSARP